ncbi:hypothetical protein D4764_04G0010030 [Takifugu flavidus]|uniref:Uncharacterized protein n=1 Tax=Takifugu flavidus TaxID=433684 RepID=A0A5C6N4Y4_9TELE|nr:hypothetical protein D4764_04G0010030 [Takifugu flavidus]
MSYGGNALIGGWGENVYIRHCLLLALVVFPLRRRYGVVAAYLGCSTNLFHRTSMQRQEGRCFLPPSFRLERFAVRARALVCTGQLAAGWCQWVTLPQREPLTEWWRHQKQSAQTTSLTGPTAALAQSFSSGLSPVRSRSLSRSLPLLPFARRNGAET